MAAFVILSAKTHATALDAMAARAHLAGGGWLAAAFLLALAGFGFKAGLVPLHVWLPEAHPVAPADGSAFLSGVVVKLGVYGIALFAFRLDPVAGAWPGLVTMGAGALTAAIGILYAMRERDIKRFLAYSTIENTGIIVTAFGAAMIFHAYRLPALSAFLLIAGLYHVANHGCYKTLLFLEAGVVEHATGTRDMDRLGGLVHRLPRSAVIAFIGHARDRRAAAAERVRQRVADLPGAVPGFPDRQRPVRHPHRARRRDARAHRRPGDLRVRPRLRHPVPRHAQDQAGRGGARNRPAAGRPGAAGRRLRGAGGRRPGHARRAVPDGADGHRGRRSARCCCPASSPSCPRTRTSPRSPRPTWPCSSSRRAPCPR